MSAKRQATSDLNHDNWNQEEEPEERGHFREATEDEIKTRVIKKARRRINDDSNPSNNGTGNKSIFGGFTGFGTATKSTVSEDSSTKASPFAFLSKLPATSTSASISTPSSAAQFSFGSGKTESNQKDIDVKNMGDNVHFSKIMKLNQSFSDWIKKHVADKPLCNLTPTFRDYEKYIQEILKDIEKEKSENGAQTNKQKDVGKSIFSTITSSSPAVGATGFTNFKFNATSSTTETNKITESQADKEKLNGKHNSPEKPNGSSTTSATFTFGQPKSNGSGNTATPVSTPFSFGAPKSDAQPGFSFGLNKPATTTAGFSFGLKKDDEKPTTSGFSFTPGSSGFSFANVKPPAADATKQEGNDDDDDEVEVVEPPKEIVEDDALYSKKCKVFVKNDNAYKDYGVGTLFLKPVKESGKTQLLVRSCNNLGTILINVILVSGMPTQRMGKNNVMIVHPSADEKETKPQTTLLRVKDGAEADELLETINKHKK